MASSASQRRAALATTTSSTGWTSVGEPLMTRKTSAVAVCCSSASSRSRCARASFSSRSVYESCGIAAVHCPPFGASPSMAVVAC